MNLKNHVYLAKRSILKSKIFSSVNIVLYSVICIMTIAVSVFIGFLCRYSDSIQKFNSDFRRISVYTDKNHNAEDIKKIFSSQSFVDLVTDSNSYELYMNLKYENQKFNFSSKQCTGAGSPEIIKGRSLNFDSSNEIVIPDKFVLYNENTGEYEELDSERLLETDIQIEKENYDYNDYYEEATNTVYIGGKYLNSTICSFKVVGIYDSDKYFEDPSVCYITQKAAKILCASDLKNESQNEVIVFSDKLINNSKVYKTAAENGLEYDEVSDALRRLRLFTMIGYAVLLFIIILGFIALNAYLKYDKKKYLSGYVLMKTVGFSITDVLNSLIIKYIILNTAAMIIVVPFSCILLARVNTWFYNNEIMGGLNISFGLTGFVVSLLVYIVFTIYMAVHYCISVNHCSFKDICK